MSDYVSTVARSVSRAGLRLEEWQVAAALRSMPHLSNDRAPSRELWVATEQAARSALTDSDYATYFDPLMRKARKSTAPAVELDAARVMVIYLATKARADQQASQGELPPYIPPQTSDKPPDIIETPSRGPRPNNFNLLPIAVAAALSAALIVSHRSQT